MRRFGIPVIASVMVLGSGLTAQAVDAGPVPKGAPRAAVAPDREVTLITGDRVRLPGGEVGRYSIEPGPGRKDAKFSVRWVKDQLSVTPLDVASAVASGRLDRRLFDVTGLIKAGYDDKASAVLPLLVTYKGQAKANRAAPAGATTTRQLPVINGQAVRVDKKNPAAFLKGLTARSGDEIDKVWLDGKRRISLDKSVPQIGAPAAWQAGYTGKGVSVAVLDTGIDATHPDLSDRVTGQKNFTTESPADLDGHGTHVASTIVGSGKASDGKYKGVAPDAKVYAGKVCGEEGCPDSAILAGMEWATSEVKAKVVNLSLGGEDSPEIDPVEEAVNKLTASTGTLFVIAAGNEGPIWGSIGSPGSADAALTVGAVDKQDQFAEFSSVGPRTGDGAVKPDVTAPGVSIVAARAKGTYASEPVGEYYQSMDGTSMATPHAAGAAVLLAQQHAGWKAPELKGALMGSAKTLAGQTVFQQGAGRINLGQAIKQTVVQDTGSVSFGTAQWPHGDDTPVTKDVAYRNLSNRAVTLKLAVKLTAPGGGAAAAGLLKLSASTLIVPAGGTAKVRATSTTKHNGADGSYSGLITATATGITVNTPVGIDKEVESYTLTVNHLGPDGEPADGNTVAASVDTPYLFKRLWSVSGTAKIRLPKGTYLLDTDIVTGTGADTAVAKIIQPELKLDRDTTVVKDARTTKPVSITVPRQDAAQALAVLGYDRTNPADTYTFFAELFGSTFKGVSTAQQGPALPAEQLTSSISSAWGVPGQNGDFVNSPYAYHLEGVSKGSFFNGYSRTVQDSELATLVSSSNAQTTDSQGEESYSGDGYSGFVSFRSDLPSKTTHYLEASPGMAWGGSFKEFRRDADGNFTIQVSAAGSGDQVYEAGTSSTERWNAAALVPRPIHASREGNELSITQNMYSDADGHNAVSAVDAQSSKLYRDGTLVAESDLFEYLDATNLPATKAEYKFVASETRPSVSPFSTRTDVVFTFNSAAAADKVDLPMLGLLFKLPVDDKNVAERPETSVMPMQITQLQPPYEVKSAKAAPAVELQVSGDDGATWQPATVTAGADGAFSASFATPKTAKTLSLKSKVINGDATIEQTVIAAYHLR